MNLKNRSSRLSASNMLHLLNDLKNFDETEDAYPFGEYHHAVMKKDFSEETLKNYLTKNIKRASYKKQQNLILKIVLWP